MNERIEDLVKKFENRWLTKSVVRGYTVSTVDLVFPHSGGNFETMVFDIEHNDCYQARYKTRELAEAGHADIVSQIEAGTFERDEDFDDD